MAKSNCAWGFNGAPGAKVRYSELAAGVFKQWPVAKKTAPEGAGF